MKSWITIGAIRVHSLHGLVRGLWSGDVSWVSVVVLVFSGTFSVHYLEIINGLVRAVLLIDANRRS